MDHGVPAVDEAPAHPRIPYGQSDFRRIRLRKWLYVDKTRFLRRLEQEDYVFLIRPRRFGKSLWVSVLENYYDRWWGHEFDAVFAGTDIGRNPTTERHRYVVLRFDFSVVNDKLDEFYLQGVKPEDQPSTQGSEGSTEPTSVDQPLYIVSESITAIVPGTFFSTWSGNEAELNFRDAPQIPAAAADYTDVVACEEGDMPLRAWAEAHTSWPSSDVMYTVNVEVKGVEVVVGLRSRQGFSLGYSYIDVTALCVAEP